MYAGAQQPPAQAPAAQQGYPPQQQQASTDPATAGYGYPGPAAAQQQQQAYDTSAQGYGYPGYPSGGADPYSAGGYGGAYGGGAYGYGARGGRPGAYGAQMGGYGPTNRWACVRLRGLPFGVHEPEINMFLGCDTVDILIARRGGRATGEAYVLLATPWDMETALRKNRAYLGSRYIEVFEASRNEYYKAVALSMGFGAGYEGEGDGRERERSPMHGGFGALPPNGSSVLKLRGLPFSCTAADVVAFFDDPALGIPPVDPEKVLLPIGPDGRASGLAFVEFDSPELAAAGLRKDRHMMGTRYVECFPSTPDERDRYQQQQ